MHQPLRFVMAKARKKGPSYKEPFDTLDPAPLWRDRRCVLWLLKKEVSKKKLKTYDAGNAPLLVG